MLGTAFALLRGRFAGKAANTGRSSKWLQLDICPGGV